MRCARIVLVCRPIFLDLVPDAHVGDYVRVEIGFATECVSEDEAERAYDQLRANTLEFNESSPEAARRVKPR